MPGASPRYRSSRHCDRSRPPWPTDRLVLPAAAPGAVVSVADPDTGATLLVGTQRRDGQGVPAERRSPEFALLPTWQGVAVEADRRHRDVATDPAGLRRRRSASRLSPPSDVADQLARAVGLTRQFDFPSQPVAALQERLRRPDGRGRGGTAACPRPAPSGGGAHDDRAGTGRRGGRHVAIGRGRRSTRGRTRPTMRR